MVSEILATGEPLLAKATAMKQAGDVRGALRTAGSIREITADMNDQASVPPAQKARLTDLSNRVTALLQGIKILVAVAERVDGVAIGSPQFQPRLVAALTANPPAGLNSSFQWGVINPDSLLASTALQGMVAKQTGSDLLLIGVMEVKINTAKAQYGIFTAKLQGRIKLVDPATSVILWEASFPNDIIREGWSPASTANDAANAAFSLKNQKKITPDQTPFDRLAQVITGAIK
jgi:hypothetical protein